MDKLLALLKKLGVADDKIDSVKDTVEELMSEASDAAVKTETAGLKKKNADLLKQIKETPGAEDLSRVQEQLEAATTENTQLKSSVKTLTKDLGKASARGDTAERELTGLYIDNEITAQLGTHKVSPTLMDGAKALLAPKASIKVEGDKKTVMFGDKVAADFVKEWASSDVGKAYTAPPLNNGSNAPGSTNNNSNGAKSMTIQAFDALSPTQRLEFSKAGGKIAEGV